MSQCSLPFYKRLIVFNVWKLKVNSVLLLPFPGTSRMSLLTDECAEDASKDHQVSSIEDSIIEHETPKLYVAIHHDDSNNLYST